MKTLRMIFGRDDGSKATVSLRYAKEDLTAETVRSAMQTVLDNPVFAVAPASILGAEVVDRTVTELIGQ